MLYLPFLFIIEVVNDIVNKTIKLTNNKAPAPALKQTQTNGKKKKTRNNSPYQYPTDFGKKYEQTNFLINAAGKQNIYIQKKKCYTPVSHLFQK